MTVDEYQTFNVTAVDANSNVEQIQVAALPGATGSSAVRLPSLVGGREGGLFVLGWSPSYSDVAAFSVSAVDSVGARDTVNVSVRFCNCSAVYYLQCSFAAALQIHRTLLFNLSLSKFIETPVRSRFSVVCFLIRIGLHF